MYPLLQPQQRVTKLRAFSSGGERFPDTEEVTSSNLVTPTKCSRPVGKSRRGAFVRRRRARASIFTVTSNPLAQTPFIRDCFQPSTSSRRVVESTSPGRLVAHNSDTQQMSKTVPNGRSLSQEQCGTPYLISRHQPSCSRYQVMVSARPFSRSVCFGCQPSSSRNLEASMA